MSAFNQQVRRCLAEMGAAAPHHRLDANETAFVEREITQVRAKIFEIVYAELKALGLIPLATDISPDVQQYVYFVLDTVGEARVIANGADDLPRVDISKSERGGIVRTVGASYGFELFEMRLAARLGTALGLQKAKACRRAIATAIDHILTFGTTNGQSGLVMEGLLNNTDVTNLGIAAGTLWVLGTTTAATMIAEISAPVTTIITATNETYIPDTIQLPTASYEVMANTPYSTQSDKTALRWFLDNNPHIKNVVSWYRGNGAGAAAKNRGLVYKRDPDCLEGVAPLQYEEQPPERRGLEMVIPAVGRVGGVKFYHPESARYIDFSLT